MPSTSKSNRPRKAKQSKFVPKPKQRWQVKQPTRNWLELPSDIMANILYRVGVYDILENAQKVCTTWRKICKDPAMWRVISMDNHGDPCTRPLLREMCQCKHAVDRSQPLLRGMCKHAVDRSQGQLAHLTITDFVDYELLQYVAERSSQLKRLEIIYSFGTISGAWGDLLKKFPLLEELSLFTEDILLEEDIEAAVRYCPLLKTLRMNQKDFKFVIEDDSLKNAMVKAIGKALPALRHLALIGSTMTKFELKAILDGCRHLETLDIRRCLCIDLRGDLGKKCVKQIKNLKLPYDSLDEPWDVSSESRLYLFDSDDDTAFGSEDSIHLEDMSEMPSSMSMLEMMSSTSRSMSDMLSSMSMSMSDMLSSMSMSMSRFG